MPKQPQDRKPSRLESVIAAADALDARRRAQIANQIVTIDRLLEDGSYAGEMAALHQDLADAKAALGDALERLREVESALGNHVG